MRIAISVIGLGLAIAGSACRAAPYVPPPPVPVRAAGPTAIGIEYVRLDRPKRIPEEARALAETGLTAVKHYAEHVQWGEMRKTSQRKDESDTHRRKRR